MHTLSRCNKSTNLALFSRDLENDAFVDPHTDSENWKCYRVVTDRHGYRGVH